MILEKELFKIGVFNKPHGVKGELVFTFTDDVFDRVDCNYLICLIDGIFVPFFVEHCRFRSETTALIQLEDVSSTDLARPFTNLAVFFPVKYLSKVEHKSDLSWDVFVGFTIVDESIGELGLVTDVDTSTVNTLFVIDQDGEELLIPAQEEFILEMNMEEKSILVQLPEGLLNIDQVETV
ncbi:MAG: ribosome maturation factor RimM [Bacteroidaceae bacterium]|nr:ribosome maturation factor RimM [Bacteroidaceae bacterium]